LLSIGREFVISVSSFWRPLSSDLLQLNPAIW
jgi:hypothetical protein